MDEVGGKNRIQGFGYPAFGDDTCTPEELVEICLREVGYLEKRTPEKLEDKKANAGDKNYTKYGKWYGGNGLYWCQQLVSWCAYTACKLHLEKNSTGWFQERGVWKYRFKGQIVSGQWLEIGGRWYVFDESGRMITGWFGDGENWYYLNPDDGAMLSGQWISNKGKSYYLTKSGAMATSAYVKKQDSSVYYWVDKDGVWISSDNTETPDLQTHDLAE